MSAPLLVVDGDSFAHRAFHALPRSIRRADGSPGNLLTGLVSMLLRLWEAERPRAVFVGWDTLFVATYRHEALSGYQAGREFDPELLEQLDLAPGLLEAAGIVCAKAAGYEADDFLAAAVASERKRKGTALVATSDRDAFQLVADDVTILQPVRGVSELARIDPAEVWERYGVEPAQVPDFIALRGDPSDKIPGARGVGAKTAASLLAQYGSLDALLDDGRFSQEADALQAIPEHRDARPDCADPRDPRPAARLAGRRRRRRRARPRPARGPAGGRRIELISHPALTPTSIRWPGTTTPRARNASRCSWRRSGGSAAASRRAGSRSSVSTTPAMSTRSPHSTARYGSTATPSQGRRRSRRRASRPAARSRRSTRAGSRSCGRPATTPCPTGRWASACCDNVAVRCASRAGRARARARRDRRLGRPSRERHRGDLPGRRLGPLRLAPPVAVLPGHRRAGDERRHDAQHPARGRRRRRRVCGGLLGARGADRQGVRPGSRARLRGVRRACGRSARRTWPSPRGASRSSRVAPPSSGRGSRSCSRAATTSRRSHDSWRRRSAASRPPETQRSTAGGRGVESSARGCFDA